MYGNSMFGNPTVAPAYPQIQPLPNQQPMYPRYAPSVLPGRMVESEEEITIADIPTDRSLALFPKKDGSCVFGRAWLGDGKMQTVKFIPEVVPVTENEEENTDSPINAYDILSEKLDNVLDLLTTPTSSKKKDKNEKEND